MRRGAGKQHLLAKKNSKRKLRLSKMVGSSLFLWNSLSLPRNLLLSLLLLLILLLLLFNLLTCCQFLPEMHVCCGIDWN